MEASKKEKSTRTTTKKVAVKQKNVPLAHSVGRRKSAVARVWLRKGNGALVVNGNDYSTYFDTEVTRLDATQPFRVVPQTAHFDVAADVSGGGLSAQAGAVKLAIARALVAFDENLKPELRKAGLVTRDARKKERKKFGRKAARRRFQFVKR